MPAAIVEKLIDEWPAVLALVVLIWGHVYFTVVQGERIQPLGVPLFAAVLVFIVAELGRQLL